MKAEPTKATRLERPGRKAVDLNAARGAGTLTVAEVMPKREQLRGGRRRVVSKRTRPGLSVFAAREKHCKNAGFAHARGQIASPRGSNWHSLYDISDCHVAAILIPFRSRGLAD